MLDLSLIDRDLTEQSQNELETTDERLAKVMSLTAADHFAESAEAAQSLFEASIYDLRILGPFLFGVYLERGLEVLPEVLGTLVRILSNSFAFWGPQNKKQLHADNMLKWLLATMLRDFRLHETGQDDTWKQWNTGSEFTIAERQGLKMVPELQERIVNQLGNAKALPYLLQLESMLHKMELSAQSARPRVGRGRDDFLSVKLGGVSAPPEEGSAEPESSDQSSSNEDSSSSQSSTESSSSESSSSKSSSTSSNTSSPSTSSTPSSTSSPSSTSTSSSQGSSDESESNQSSPSSSSSPSGDEKSDAEKAEEEEKSKAEAEAREAKEREEAERAARAEEVAAVQAEETPAEAESPGNGKGVRSINIPENEPFRQLRRKLAAFQKLVSAGEHQRAAIVAADLLQTLDHFDPRLYLPTLFRKFFRVLAIVGDDLTPHMEERRDLSYKALLQLYQVDLDYFVRSASSKRK